MDELQNFSMLSASDKEKVEAWFASGGTPKKRSADEVASLAALDPKKMKVTDLKKSLSQAGGSATGSKKELQEAVEELKQRAAAEALYTSKSVPELKALCELNSQLKGGSKSELVERCVDGKLYGALPRCPLCGGGILRVVYTAREGHKGQGRFSCPGYFDDDHFVRCKYSSDAADRLAWKE